MTEEEFLKRWFNERPMYEAWGRLVASTLIEKLQPILSPISTDVFVRIPVKHRLKEDGSIIDKAFYRKNYDDPYEQVTDKVGVRFVVLLGSEIEIISKAIESCDWDWSKDKDYEQEKKDKPYQFAYQSVHYIVRNKVSLKAPESEIAPGTPCEIQVRTLLQHAHSEMTHDTIYKPSVIRTPEMERAAAKSMALIEATNDYFEEVARQIKDGVTPSIELSKKLAAIYQDFTCLKPQPTKSEGLLNDALLGILVVDPIDALQKLLKEKTFIAERIKERASRKLLFRQPSILLAYLAVSLGRDRAEEAWPLTAEELKPILIDLGES